MSTSLRLVVLLILVLPLAAGPVACRTDGQIERDDLRERSRNPEVSREDRVAELLATLRQTKGDPHQRATAAQMLGDLGVVGAVPDLLRILGHEVAVRDTSTFLRMEAAGAIAVLGTIEDLRIAVKLLYPDPRSAAGGEPSPEVRRQFIQEIQQRDAGDPQLADLLVEMLHRAHQRGEGDSLIWTLTVELQRVAGRDDLGPDDLAAWDEWLEELRRRDRDQESLPDFLERLRPLQMAETLDPETVREAFAGSPSLRNELTPGGVAQYVLRIEALLESGIYKGPREDPYETGDGPITIVTGPADDAARLRIQLRPGEE